MKNAAAGACAALWTTRGLRSSIRHGCGTPRAVLRTRNQAAEDGVMIADHDEFKDRR